MKQVLVVDASRAMRSALHAIIESLGFQYDETADGASAIARCAAHRPPDAVLYREELPGMNARSFISTLRRTAEAAHPPVIVIGAHHSLEQIADALRHGATEYLMPPFDGEILAGRLDACGVSR
jgi:DNA-binding response OmpR family regulator